MLRHSYLFIFPFHVFFPCYLFLVVFECTCRGNFILTLLFFSCVFIVMFLAVFLLGSHSSSCSLLSCGASFLLDLFVCLLFHFLLYFSFFFSSASPFSVRDSLEHFIDVYSDQTFCLYLLFHPVLYFSFFQLESPCPYAQIDIGKTRGWHSLTHSSHSLTPSTHSHDPFSEAFHSSRSQKSDAEHGNKTQRPNGLPATGTKTLLPNN